GKHDSASRSPSRPAPRHGRVRSGSHGGHRPRAGTGIGRGDDGDRRCRARGRSRRDRAVPPGGGRARRRVREHARVRHLARRRHGHPLRQSRAQARRDVRPGAPGAAPLRAAEERPAAPRSGRVRDHPRAVGRREPGHGADVPRPGVLPELRPRRPRRAGSLRAARLALAAQPERHVRPVEPAGHLPV
ncbi:MAG: hypothetical protein AVDCRST_MAG11-3710, partial [uncultured Gemmatimonadaceae bacterium]